MAKDVNEVAAHAWYGSRLHHLVWGMIALSMRGMLNSQTDVIGPSHLEETFEAALMAHRGLSMKDAASH